MNNNSSQPLSLNIKEDTTGKVRKFVREPLDGSLKNNLIKDNRCTPNPAIDTTENAAAFKPASEAQAYADMKFNRAKTKGVIRSTLSYTRQGIERATTYSGQNGDLGERTAGKGVEYAARTPRYIKNTAGIIVSTGRNLRYSYKLYKDVKAGALTGKEASLAALKRGGNIIKAAGVGSLKTLGRTVDEFYGSDDLGIEAVRRTKDTLIRTYRTLKVTSRAFKHLKQTPKRTLRNMQKAAQKAQQAAQYAAAGIKAGYRVLSNPAVLKSIAITAIILLPIILIIACVTSVSALFSNFTYPANDTDLTDAWTYVTELDTNLAKKIKDIPSDSKWSDIDEFHINAFEPKTDPMPIISYLSVKYEDFKFNDVKAEMKAIHNELYKLNYHEWTEVKHHDDWDETIYHLDVDLEYTPFQAYVAMHKAEMFPQPDDYARYETYNKIGGTTFRAELGVPYVGKKVNVSTRFGWRLDPESSYKEFHAGIDIPMEEGTPINAAMEGTVTTEYDADGYGKYLVITSGDRKTLYGHCSSFLVSNGQTVSKGQEIATTGNTGKSTGSHLHLEFEKNGKKLNPFFYLELEQFISGLDGGLTGPALGTGDYAALIEEAEKYLGYPYKFGGKTPETGFDCSGFVCWVLTHAGIKNISTTAQGLYNNCTPISETEVKPGDLIFFTDTYDCPDVVSHVAFYIGDGIMLHCGDPIQYTTFETSYWQSHFYAYGRLN